MDFMALAHECAPAVHPLTMAAVARVESGYNPLAIGVVGGRLVRQPENKAEAVATARALAADGWNFSVGVGQVNRYNLGRFGLDYDTAFDACPNLRAGAAILSECFSRAKNTIAGDQPALQAAISCYYSGNFSRGFVADVPGGTSYVQRVIGAGAVSPTVQPIPVVRAAALPSPRGDAGRPQAPFRVTVQAAPANPAATPAGDVYGTSGADSAMVYR